MASGNDRRFPGEKNMFSKVVSKILIGQINARNVTVGWRRITDTPKPTTQIRTVEAPLSPLSQTLLTSHLSP